MLIATSIAAAFALLQEAAAGAASCQWEAEVAPATTSDGHRLRVVFLDTDGQVTISLGDQVLFDRQLETSDPSTGYSGGFQCRLAGQQWLAVEAFGQETLIGLWMDEPNLVTVHASAGRVQVLVDQTDQPPPLD